jgi:ketosteroid isomerase-like protein
VAEDRCAALFTADAAHRAAIDQLGPVDGLLRSLRGNAVYLAAGIDLVRGIRGIREALLAANPESADTQLALTLAGGDCSADGNFGFSFGWLERTADSVHTYGTYLAVWERGEGEDFRITAYYTRSSPFPHIPARAGFPLFLGGAGAGGVPHAGGLEEHRRSVAATDREFAATSVAQGYSVAFPAYANPDFLMVFGRNFVGLVGETEIASAYAGWTPSETLDWAPVYVGAAASGDLAYTVGNALDTYIDANGTVTNGYSKYLSLWARTADGVWSLIADGGSPNPPPVTGEQP